MAEPNVFAGAYVDRSGDKREDPRWLKTALSSPEARFAPVWRDKCLASGDPPRIALLTHRDMDPLLQDSATVFLGVFNGRPSFAVDVDCVNDAPFEHAGEFHDLRYLGSVLPADEANLVAHAIAVVHWHHVQKFCGLCGAPTAVECGGTTRLCTAADCTARLFPRVDPAIIVLVTRGDSCLLGRQKSWPEGRYSTIAGFVEPGESLEDAVCREVLEETNVAVRDVQYHSSQPWPFPSSLMLGFTAAGGSEVIRLNDAELEDAQWFSRKECCSGFPKLPFKLSIARRLIDDWLKEE